MMTLDELQKKLTDIRRELDGRFAAVEIQINYDIAPVHSVIGPRYSPDGVAIVTIKPGKFRNALAWNRSLMDTISRTEYEGYGWCMEQDCLAKPHRLVVQSHEFSGD